jgi:beta-fructofuranosidase
MCPVKAMICLLLVAATASAAEPDLYKPRGQKGFDYWYARSGQTYHAFYLQRPDAAGQGNNTSVGLATSKDLINWTEVGEILRADPKAAWCNVCIATGSTWRGKDRWQMLFTAHGGPGGNVGLAESDDLTQWTTIGPVRIDYRNHVVPNDPYWQRCGLKPGEKIAYRIAADPYVLPEAIDGWRYMIANCTVVGRPLNQRGCIGLMRSRDGRTWEDCGIISLMLDYDRPETPQLWQHGDRWYLYFGGAREGKQLCRHNRIYTARSMRGPFEPPPRSELTLPDGRRFYIAKVLTAPQGGDVLLAAIGGSSMSQPYPVTYEPDGSLTLKMPEKK